MVEELRVLKRMIEDNRGPYMYFLFLSQAVASIPPPTGLPSPAKRGSLEGVKRLLRQEGASF